MTAKSSLQDAECSVLLLQDTYHNLTLKTVMGLKWTSIFCPQARFVMKTDDDIFVNLSDLHEALTKEDFSRITGSPELL